MSFLGSLLGNEVSHNSNLFSGFGVKNGEQLLLGAADPIGAKLWGGVTGQNFTPMVTQLGGETPTQYGQSDAQGVNTGPSRFMGSIADAIAGAEAGSYFNVPGGLFTAGSNALTPGETNSAGITAAASAPYLASGQGRGFQGAAPIDITSTQTPQQRLAAALMLPPKQQQGSALDNVASIANQSPTVRMLNRTPPYSLGGPTQ